MMLVSCQLMGSSFSKIKECTQPSTPIPPSSSSLKHGPKEKKRKGGPLLCLLPCLIAYYDYFLKNYFWRKWIVYYDFFLMTVFLSLLSYTNIPPHQIST